MEFKSSEINLVEKEKPSNPVTAEVIRFISPKYERTNLYVSGLTEITLSKEQLHDKLQTVFSEFGLIYEVQIFPTSKERPHGGEDQTAPSNSYYGFVKFFSPFATAKAIKALNKKYVIQGKLLKVSFSTRKATEDYPLHYSACCSLAQHYVGFNGWNSEVIQIHEDKDHGDPSLVRFLCAVRLNVPKHSVTCDGIGLSEAHFNVKEPSSRLEAFKKARRNCFSRAMENAFHQLAIVVLSNGKVSVQLCQEKPDEMIFMDDEIRQQIIKVSNVEGFEEEKDKEEDEESDSHLQEDISLLDAINNEILLDLMVDS